ncbi:MAG: ABC transporter permease [Anaerolineae bacterium]|nr:ABC transporter permease [Anaerolineae bacterium]
MSLTIKTDQTSPNIRRFIQRHFRVGIAFIILFALLGVTASLNARFFTPAVITSTSNQSMTLVFAGMAQTTVVTTGGIDLSVGPIISMSNSLASAIFVETDSSLHIILVVVIVLAVAALAGLINGVIVVYGRLQPIIVTLATSSIYSGIALFLRPRPGGFVPDIYGDLLTKRVGQLLPESLFTPNSMGIAGFFQSLFDTIPASAILLVIVLLLVWTPFRRSRLGMWVYAVGSNEGAAYMSGVNVKRAKVSAYVLGGLFAGIAGLFLTAQTRSGDATTGAVFTLQSIAVVVLGGTSLFGGSGGVAGTIVGAFALRLIPSILFFARVNPLQQPLWEGTVILLAVAAGASRIFTVRNRLDTMR